MTNVSKRKLKKETEQQLFSQFTSVFGNAPQKQQSELFMALFTETERIMFIKRLAVVFLLTEKYSTYSIAKTLLVSDATVRSVKASFLEGKYDPIVFSMKQKTFDKQKFWKTVEVLLRGGLPPRGRGRWKWFYEQTGTIATKRR